jgi:hypothetical protein
MPPGRPFVEAAGTFEVDEEAAQRLDDVIFHLYATKRAGRPSGPTRSPGSPQ